MANNLRRRRLADNSWWRAAHRSPCTPPLYRNMPIALSLAVILCRRNRLWHRRSARNRVRGEEPTLLLFFLSESCREHTRVCPLDHWNIAPCIVIRSPADASLEILPVVVVHAGEPPRQPRTQVEDSVRGSLAGFTARFSGS